MNHGTHLLQYTFDGGSMVQAEAQAQLRNIHRRGMAQDTEDTWPELVTKVQADTQVPRSVKVPDKRYLMAG